MPAKEEEPITYLLRNIPAYLKEKLNKRAKESKRSIRVVILDAIEKYLS